MRRISCFRHVLLAVALAAAAACQRTETTVTPPAAGDASRAPAAAAARPTPKVRVSGWYWLNSAPKEDWARDFKQMAALGFTDVLFGWGLDAAAFGTRVADSTEAIRLAHEAGLGSYLCIWHPTHNNLERKAEFQQVSPSGQVLFTFDTFNPVWRQTQWKEYLQRVARAYRNQPGFAGYVFDDSFMQGGVGTQGGPGVKKGDDLLSYGAFEKKAFGEPLPTSKADKRWEEWIAKRAEWWEDWARDTVGFIREIDPDKAHEIYLEDHDYILDPIHREKKGLDFARVAKHFDAVGAYTMAEYDDSPDTGKKAVERTLRAIRKIREIVGPDRKIIYTFWIANPKEEFDPQPAKYPTVEQIAQIADAARAEGITHLDMYGYRIGDFRVTDENWKQKWPGTGPSYPVTGQFPNKFLWDRPALHDGFGRYFRGLNAAPAGGTR